MKNRDILLFGLPVGAALLIAAFMAFLYWQTTAFETSYRAEARANIEQEAKLAAAVVQPLLDAGKLDEAAAFCASFHRDTLRVSLIDAEGRVAADSRENAAFLGNHLDREEVRKALAGTPAGAVRYSESLDLWMMYYALPLKTTRGEYVLRTAVSTDRVSRMIDLARLNMLWALLFGAEIVIVFAIYMVNRVRRPLIRLQKNVAKIADGDLDAPIDIPENGVVRELAAGVAEMTQQLKSRLAETMRERNEKDTLLETMSEGVLLFSEDGMLLRHNAAAAGLFDFAEDGRFNLSRSQLPDLIELAHRTLRTGDPFEREFTLSRGGVARSLFIRGRALFDEGEKRLLLTVSELTNLHRLESFRSDFVANVSHEIKTPLTCIVGAVEALDDDGGEAPPEQRHKLLGILKAQASRLNNLIRDILSLASLEKQQLDSEHQFEPAALDSVLVNAVNLCIPHAAQAGIALSIVKNVGLTAPADCQLLEQSVVNLIENAIKYSGSAKIDASLIQDGADAVISIRDYGIGIAPEHAKRIFERFYRVDKSRSRQLGGTGLGLAIVKHIVQLHRGSVSVESKSGQGCDFKIRIPLAKME